MNQDIPETYEELKEAYIAECKERYENNEHSRQLLRELLRELNGEIANLEREKEELEVYEEEVTKLECEKEELGKEIEELLEERQRDTIAEVRSARDKAIQ